MDNWCLVFFILAEMNNEVAIKPYDALPMANRVKPVIREHNFEYSRKPFIWEWNCSHPNHTSTIQSYRCGPCLLHTMSLVLIYLRGSQRWWVNKGFYHMMVHLHFSTIWRTQWANSKPYIRRNGMFEYWMHLIVFWGYIYLHSSAELMLWCRKYIQ